jgi:hypothetical protein
MIEEQIVLGQIYLGKQGENGQRIVKFREPTIWNTTIGNGTCELLHTRCGDTEPYTVNLEYTNDCAIWKVCTYDTACDGKGQCELRYIVDGAVVRAETYTTTVLPISVVVEDEEVPEITEKYVEEVLEAKAEIERLCNDVDSELNTKANDDLSNVTDSAFKAKAESAGVGSGGDATLTEDNKGFKKIGFTSDCDYIATSSDGYTAFNNAINEAKDGDTIYVMPGTYSSTSTLYIRKNLNFIGVRMPNINIPINIPCTSYFDGENYSVVYGDSYMVGFQGIKFNKAFIVGIFTDYGECDASDVVCDDCYFTLPSMEICGVFYNCFFDVEGSIRTGSYYGETSYFYNCDISCGGFSEADVYAYGTDIRFTGNNSYNVFGGGGSYYDCNIYMNKSGLDDNCDHMYISFNRCRFYGYDFDRYNGTYTECYKVSETAI